MEEEVWKDIEGFEGYYQASNLGRIRSVDREVAGKAGCVRILKGKVLKPEMNNDGYLLVGLCKESKQKFFSVHRLVWMTFNGEIPSGMQVNHLNEVKTDNRLENLNLMTPKQNNNWGTRTERAKNANTNHPSLSKPVIALDKDGNIVFQFPSTMEGERNGYNNRKISACCLGKQKTHRGLRWEYKN